LRPSLHLDVERDDGDHILLRLHRKAQPSEPIGWLLYHLAKQTLKDVSKIVQDEDVETAFSGEYGKRLVIDRRFAQLFDKCRQRLNLGQIALCQQLHQKSNIDITNLPLRAQGRVALLNKGEAGRSILYFAADEACPIGEDVAMKAGASLKIFSESGDFYFVRQDKFGSDFITGWILKDHVQNIKYLAPPASTRGKDIEVTPVSKPVAPVDSVSLPANKPKQQPAVKSAPLPLLEPDFDTQELETTSVIVTEPVAMAEEVEIPVPVMVKPVSSDRIEEIPSQQRSHPVPLRMTNRRDG